MIEAMKQMVEALEIEMRMYEAADPESGAPYNMIEAINAGRQAIEELEKKHLEEIEKTMLEIWQPVANAWNPINTHPPKREWVGLTDEEISRIEDEYIVDYRIPAGSAWNFAKDIEAALRSKNT